MKIAECYLVGPIRIHHKAMEDHKLLGNNPRAFGVDVDLDYEPSTGLLRVHVVGEDGPDVYIPMPQITKLVAAQKPKDQVSERKR